MPFRPENRRFTTGVVVLVASMFVIVIGVQSYLGNKADREYSDCMTRFAEDLVAALSLSREANAEVTKAQTALANAGERKDRALDHLITISQTAQQSGAQTQDELPPGLLDEYEKALNERVAAQRAYDKVKAKADRLTAEAERTRQEHPLVPPKATCSR